jgi:UDP:flavonoid glycosyltransferase YjiC (YdhE family)
MQRRGHRATILTSSQHRLQIEQAGIRFQKGAPDLDFTDKVFQERAMREVSGGRYLLRDVILPQIRSSYDDLLAAVADADLLVTHMLTYAGPLVAEKTGVPWVSTVLAPLSFFSYRDSPVLASRLNGLRNTAPWLNALINRVARSTMRPWNEPVNQLKRELGLSPGGEPIYDGQHSPSRVLAMFSPLLAQQQRDWPVQTQISGFPFFDNASGGTDIPQKLIDFMANGPAPVVFTLGTSAVLNPGRFYDASIEAVRKLGVRAVLLDGTNGSDGLLDRNIFSLAFAPHSWLFSRASVVVHSGGIGTTANALRAGRPMLVVPFAYDQPDNALRLVRLGVARTIGRNSYTAGRSAEAIRMLLSQPRYRIRAESVARLIRAEDGTKVACDTLENFL